jgi:hypothetical protein
MTLPSILLDFSVKNWVPSVTLCRRRHKYPYAALPSLTRVPDQPSLSKKIAIAFLLCRSSLPTARNPRSTTRWRCGWRHGVQAAVRPPTGVAAKGTAGEAASSHWRRQRSYLQQLVRPRARSAAPAPTGGAARQPPARGVARWRASNRGRSQAPAGVGA